MSEFLEDLEISSVYLAPALNKDDLSSSVRDNRSSNETLTQKQMFSEAKIILSHRVNFSLVVPWKNLFVRCFATCANGKRAGVEKLWILEKFRILDIDRVYISQISSKMKFNIIERKEGRGGKKNGLKENGIRGIDVAIGCSWMQPHRRQREASSGGCTAATCRRYILLPGLQ